MSYSTTPSNFDDCSSYLQVYNAEVQKIIITSSKVYVIDTCAFQFFMRSNRASLVSDYIALNNGCVIIFRTILMELSGDRGYLENSQIEFIRTLHQKGIPVFVLFEEDLKELLQIYTDNGRINNFLRLAVQCVKGPTGIINRFLGTHCDIKKAIFNDSSIINPDLYKLFWSELRKEKTHGDNLGEYACAISIHILAEMEDIYPYKYIFLTEDKPAIGIMSRVIKNTRIHQGCDLIGCATSAKIVERSYASGIISDKEGIKNFLMPTSDSKIKSTVLDLYALSPEIRSFSVDDFADYICNGIGTIVF